MVNFEVHMELVELELIELMELLKGKQLIRDYMESKAKIEMIINKIQLPTTTSLGLIPLLKPISASSACSSKFQDAKQQHHALLQFRYFMIF